MTKMTRIALAALAVMGATTAMAQSSVTLYGRINTTIESQKLSGQSSVAGMHNNASRWGVRGTEDLGGGLKAGFVLESGFNSDDGQGTPKGGMTFKRQSEVNLSGGFGMIRLGNFFPESYFASADYVSMHNHDTGSSSDALYQDPNWMGASVGGQGAPEGVASGLGTGNKVAYRTPSMSGFWAEGSVSMHEKADGTNKKNGYDLAANYNNGPLALGAGYSYWNSNWQASLRGLYSIGAVTFGGYYQRNDETFMGTRNNFRLSAMYTMGASEFHANVGRANSWSTRSGSSATQYTLGYNYNLSKRTKVYGYYTKVNNSANAIYATGKAGVDFSSVAVGIRHNF